MEEELKRECEQLGRHKEEASVVMSSAASSSALMRTGTIRAWITNGGNSGALCVCRKNGWPSTAAGTPSMTDVVSAARTLAATGDGMFGWAGGGWQLPIFPAFFNFKFSFLFPFLRPKTQNSMML